MSQFLLKGSPLGNYKGVLFDKDGTLCNSEKSLTVIAKIRIKETIKLLQREKFDEQKINETSSILSKIYGLEEMGLSPNQSIAIGSRKENLFSTATVLSITLQNWSKAVLLANKIFLYADIELNKSEQVHEKPLLPGALNFLKQLKKNGIKCALISNDTKQGILNFIEINNLSFLNFDCWSCEDNPTKPNPEAVNRLCKRMDLTPSECILIGDADTDLKMGLDARIGLAIGFQGGWEIKPDISFNKNLVHGWDELSIK